VVGVLIRMKLRVLSHSLGGSRAASFAFGALVGLAAGGVSLFLVTIGYQHGASIGTTVASVLLLLWTIGWLIGPIIMGGGDETLRPENFALLPLSPTQVAQLREDHGIYMAGSGRINLAGLTVENIDTFARALNACLQGEPA